MLRLPFRHHPSRLEVFLSLALKEGIKNIYSTTFINICCKSHRIHLSLFTPYHEFNNMGNEYTVFPQLVPALELYPPLNTTRT